jgi:hypothetical protein
VSYTLALVAGALVGSVVTVIVTTGSGSPPAHQTTPVALHTSGPVVMTVQNKVALGASQLIEDTTPAYLSTKPVPYCTRLGCRMLGTEVASGAMLVAVCHVTGTEMFNYNLDSSESKVNPNRADSTLWYKAVWPDGRSGYIAEVYIVPSDRGGMGLPVCSR